MNDLKLMLITNNPAIGERAVASGVDRLFVDMETRGKFERQGTLDTHMASHTPADVQRLRNTLPEAEILARINPLYDGTGEEISAVVEAGADFVMLPMFTDAQEVGSFLELLRGRAGATLLLETPQALARIDEVLAYRHDIEEIHVGLNDLHLGLGLDFMFEVLSGGLVDYLAAKITAAGIRFGFGGIARLGEGVIPAELVIGEHVRLQSELVILSRSFHGRSRTIEELDSRIDMGAEVRKIRECVANFKRSDASLLDRNRAEFVDRVRSFVRDLRGRESVIA